MCNTVYITLFNNQWILPTAYHTLQTVYTWPLPDRTSAAQLRHVHCTPLLAKLNSDLSALECAPISHDRIL